MKNYIFFPGKKRVYHEEEQPKTQEAAIRQIAVERIISNPFRVRRNCDGEAIIRLADSIKRYGILEPIGVRRFNSGKYEIVFGERRLCAAKLIDMEKVPCIVIENISRKTACELNYIENNMREPFDINERAVSVEILMRRFDMPLDQICRSLSVYRDEIRFLLEILRLSGEEKRLISSGKITAEQLKAVLKVENAHVRKHLMRVISENGIPASGCESFINEFVKSNLKNKEQTTEHKRRPPKPVKKLVLGDLRVFTNSVDKAVEAVKTSGARVECVKNSLDDGVNYTITVMKPQKV